MDTVAVYNRRNQLAKIGTSGYANDVEFNSDLDSVQKELANMLCDNYENNQKVSDALANHIVSINKTADANGRVEKEANYLRLLSILYNGTYSTTKIATNEIGMYSTGFVRKMSLANNEVGYYFMNGVINMMPKVAMPVTLIYCKQPKTATIVTTNVNTPNSDYLNVTSSTDLEWPDSLFNLIVYMLLERMGIQQRENLIFEYSQLGISKDFKEKQIA